MLLEYIIQLGTPCGNRVAYDEREGVLKTERAEEEKLCFLVSPDMKLRVQANVENGNIVGLEYTVGKLDELPAFSFCIADYTQGLLRAKWSKGKLIESCSYLLPIDGTLKYDAKTRTLLLGEYRADGVVVQVADNLFAITGGDSSLCGFFVRL